MNISFLAHRPPAWDLERSQPALYLSDVGERPFTVPEVEGCRIQADIGQRDAVHLHARWRVEGFGEITLLTGALKPREEPYNLNVEIAYERLRLVNLKCREWEDTGFRPSPLPLSRIEEAEQILSYADNAADSAVAARWADLSLSVSVPAGEAMALEFAEWGMEKRKTAGGLADFRLGCLIQDTDDFSSYDRSFASAFNFACVNFCWNESRTWMQLEGKKHEYNWSKIDEQLQWLKSNNIPRKGHPLFWLVQEYVPKWLDFRSLEPDEVIAAFEAHIRTVVERYRGVVDYWVATNEVQFSYVIGQWTRRADTTADYDSLAVELTRRFVDLVHEVNPDAVCSVNVNEPFGEHLATSAGYGMYSLDYFRRLIDDGVNFDVMEVQVYHGSGWAYCRDLFEMSRHFDRYESLGMPLVLSEMGAPSAECPDDLDHSGLTEIFWSPVDWQWRASDAGYWRGPWTEERQADWVEGFIKVLMGKDFVKGALWWAFTDEYYRFFTHSGVLDRKGQEKELHRRLTALKRDYLD